MTTIMCDRMQNLSINNGGTGAEPKFYHYCYVCNTQLNSCKQALLHCSGKRHKKKLHFLQSRKHAVAHQMPTHPFGAQPAATVPPTDPSAVGFPQPFYQPMPSAGPFPPNMGAFLPEVQSPGIAAPPALMPPPQSGQTGFFQPVLSPAAMAGTEQWLHPPPQSSFNGPPPLLPVNGEMHLMHAPTTMAALTSPSSSSPLPSTDVSSSSYSGGRSALISPSETSSVSSDHSGVRPSYRCQVCHRHFLNGAQLHSHLQTAKHFKHHSHHFRSHSSGTSKDDSSGETECNIYYCSVCSIAVNSQTQLQSHNSGQKHRLRSTTGQKRHSRSSSTSSEHTGGEPALESGYTSGSGDEVLRVVSGSPNTFKCQPCNTFLNSSAQAKQHLNSPKHLQHVSGRPPFRRKSDSLRRKSNQTACREVFPSQPDDDEHSLSDRCETPSSPTDDPTENETDSTLTTARATDTT